ncbi:M48 family metallopeptidase [Azospira restricta]|uniref:M48 family metallopeptidase n=1 Tax=Azospira restricta TaxID=404405 RepID=A0A974PYH7_9RHOO|nr:M48 family metallopeptidase [Azospira restricta]
MCYCNALPCSSPDRPAVLRRPLLILACLLATAVPLPVAAEGVDVGNPSMLRNLVPAEQLERASAQQYRDLLREAAAKKALAPDGHPQLERIRRIGTRLVQHAARFNPRAGKWQWEINLIGSKQINAFCMPGGKIAVYTGLVDGLKLTDDEIAVVVGHEIAHALREHARARMVKSGLTQLGAIVAGELLGGGRYTDVFQFGGDMLTLKFSRNDETDADLVGLELTARAGYDPRAGITLWQKMSAASKGEPFAWFSTHPSGPNRIKEIERQLPQVMPLYERAAAGR